MSRRGEVPGAAGTIRTWRSSELAGVELRLGHAVTEPYPRHWHEEVQLCLATAGGGTLWHRGRAHDTPPGSLFVVHPGEIHANQADHPQGCSFRSMYLPAEVVRRVAAQVGPAELPFFPQPVLRDCDVAALYERLHRALELVPAARLEAEALFVELFARMVGRHAAGPLSAPRLGRERSAVRRAREFLAATLAENVSLERLAEVAGLSPYHLSRVFRAEVGIPPHAYQVQLRILRAKALLREGRKPAEVAAATGFVDQSHFSRHFRWLVKLTPGRYARGARTYKKGRAEGA
jgi:AraC-like DNA-binding protein/quercetin dioxygenase-like cupin family protein